MCLQTVNLFDTRFLLIPKKKKKAASEQVSLTDLVTIVTDPRASGAGLSGSFPHLRLDKLRVCSESAVSLFFFVVTVVFSDVINRPNSCFQRGR